MLKVYCYGQLQVPEKSSYIPMNFQQKLVGFYSSGKQMSVMKSAHA